LKARLGQNYLRRVKRVMSQLPPGENQHRSDLDTRMGLSGVSHVILRKIKISMGIYEASEPVKALATE